MHVAMYREFNSHLTVIVWNIKFMCAQPSWEITIYISVSNCRSVMHQISDEDYILWNLYNCKMLYIIVNVISCEFKMYIRWLFGAFWNLQ